MTDKKQYHYIYCDDGTEMIEKNGDYITNMEEATDLLNEQNQQIKQLKKEIKAKDKIIKLYYEQNKMLD